MANEIFKDVKAENGTVKALLGTSSPVTAENSTDVVKFNFKIKDTAANGETVVSLKSVATAQTNGGYDALDVVPVSYTHLDVYKRQVKITCHY